MLLLKNKKGCVKMLTKEKLDEKLQAAQERLEKKRKKIDSLRTEYEDQLSEIESEAEVIENEIEEIQLEIETLSFNNIFGEKYSGDIFMDAVIRASKIAQIPINENFEFQNNIYFDENHVFGCNTRIGVISQVDVPKNLTKTMVPANTRVDFASVAQPFDNQLFEDLTKAMSLIMEGKKNIFTDKASLTAAIIQTNDKVVTLNGVNYVKQYMDVCMDILPNSTGLIVYHLQPFAPTVITSSNIQVIITPTR